MKSLFESNSIDYTLIKAKSRKQLAKEYDVSVRTLARWFRKSKLDIPRGLISPSNLLIIYEKFGIPGKMLLQIRP